MYKGMRLSDIYQLIRPTGPVFAFVVPWTLVLCGQQMALCRIIIPQYSSFYLIIIGNILTSIIGAFCLQLLIGQSGSLNRQKNENFYLSNQFKRITYFFVFINLSLQFFQMLYFEGFPLLWLVLQSNKNYFDYGIASLNGLINAIYLLSTTAFYLIYLQEKSWKKFLLLTLLFTQPILLVSRQLFISLFLQIACCSLIYHPQRIKRFAFISVAILLIFILVGNYRTGLTHLIEILEPEPFIPSWMHSLLWIYAYIVTPFNNINASIDYMQPCGSFNYELRALLPNVVKNQFDLNFDFSDVGFSLVHHSMTVASFYFGPLVDFGNLYAFFFMAIFQVLLFLSFRKAVRTKASLHIIEYAVLYMIMILSIFDNLFLYLPVLTQLFLINCAKLRFVYQSRIWTLKWGKS